jgi:guanylate kinase
MTIKLANKNRGKLFTIAAPSGAGKTSLVRKLVPRVENLDVSVSYTTRAPRPSEREAINYHFVDAATFTQMIKHGEFLEYAKIYQHHYGTAKSTVAAALAANKNIILEIDWQGVDQIQELFPDCISIFILPPSLEALKQRLMGRGQDSEAVIVERLAAAKEEIAHCQTADYWVVNDNFEEALDELEAIVTGNAPASADDKLRQQSLIKQLLA